MPSTFTPLSRTVRPYESTIRGTSVPGIGFPTRRNESSRADAGAAPTRASASAATVRRLHMRVEGTRGEGGTALVVRPAGLVALGDRLHHDVAVGDDALQLLVLDHEQRADVVLPHLLRRVLDAVGRLDLRWAL